MKKSILLLALISCSLSFAGKKDAFTKNVWSILSATDSANSALFKPYNTAINPGWDVKKWDYTLQKYEEQKPAIKFNLWTILKYHFMKGDITIYCPFDPNWFDHKDDGQFLYPLTCRLYGEDKSGSYQTDEQFKRFVKEGFWGRTDWAAPLINIQSQVDPSQDSVDAVGNKIYYPREYTWHTDKDVIEYKIREHWIMDAEGNIVSKEIKAIAPRIIQTDYKGVVVGKMDLFWVDFEELVPILQHYYMLKTVQKKEKVWSFKKYFQEAAFENSIVKKDSTYIQKVAKKK